ncbi:hypothetical protein PYCCODRAFT_1422348 [Trametes coccinea BRFM310]|uniref:Uncharacterized protein n=1 Tax=Trametes coccinea (strain BRFM310) TaxID=1353009 RepID=A0A1Y2J071_TRAC3|nr:hypothetical protein PYCCODRAFT_1422348 [Trametes coccinea BRFM310]
MSFPAILRNPGLSDRFAHLRVSSSTERTSPSLSARRNKRDEKEGKRWVRRKENARFVGNAHIVAPSRKDYAVPTPSGRTTFPQPLPNYLSRNNPIPPVNLPSTEPSSANAGRFSLSLKGMRRELRKAGPRTELLVREVEDEIMSWLTSGGVMLSPDSHTELAFPGVPIGTSETITEVSRTPLQLVWSITEDAFSRYVVHCCARYHEIVSFSKDVSGQRLTYLLRPNVTRPSRHAVPVLDTPPVTDLSEMSELSAHEFDTDSELVSDRDLSDIEGDPLPRPARGLGAIVEVGSDASAPASPALVAVHYSGSSVPSMAPLDDGWSVISGSDAEGDLSAPEAEGDTLERGVVALSLSDAEMDVDRTFVAEVVRRQGAEALRSRLLERQRRSASSPSRSPARRTPRRGRARQEPARMGEALGRKSFYDYLYA